MAGSESAQLHPQAQELTTAFKEDGGGRLALPLDELRGWAQRLRGLPEEERKQIALHLVVVAQRLRGLAPDRAEEGILQLVALAAVVLADPARASDLFDQAGLKVDRQKLLGVDGPDLSKVPSERPHGVGGLLGILGDNKPKK